MFLQLKYAMQQCLAERGQNWCWSQTHTFRLFISILLQFPFPFSKWCTAYGEVLHFASRSDAGNAGFDI